MCTQTPMEWQSFGKILDHYRGIQWNKIFFMVLYHSKNQTAIHPTVCVTFVHYIYKHIRRLSFSFLLGFSLSIRKQRSKHSKLVALSVWRTQVVWVVTEMEFFNQGSPSYYAVLGVRTESSIDEIRRAYRKLAMVLLLLLSLSLCLCICVLCLQCWMICACAFCGCSNGIRTGGPEPHLCWVKPSVNSNKSKKPIQVPILIFLYLIDAFCNM